jgi:HK97 family phage major capsid protein
MSVIETLKARRKVDKASLEVLSIRLAGASASEARTMRPKFAAGVDELGTLDARIDELQEQELRENRAAAHRVETGTAGGRFTTNENSPYQNPREVGVEAPSFFRDLRDARLGNQAAGERLGRNQQIRASENRAISTTAGAGGQFAPPDWIVSEWIALARAGRVTADLLNKQPLPLGVSSLNLPKVSGGSSTAVQVTQNNQISNTDLQSTSVSSGITTISGQQIVSLQLVAQSGIPFDEIILGDLAADFARSLDLQVITGTGANGQLRGLENGASVGTTAYTTASPALVSATSANSFYNAVVRSANALNTTRFLPATHVVMHPQRWAWCLEALDANLRPIVLTNGAGFNNVAISGEPTAEGAAGVLANLPVYTDNNVPANKGTNQDEVFVIRASDIFLYEGELALESFDSTYANQNSLLYRAVGFAGMIPDRYSASVNIIGGTGLVTPSL